MDHFTYNNRDLFAEEISIAQIAQHVPTPFYCYSTATLTRHFEVFSEGFKNHDTLICFALKANSNIAVLNTLAQLGSGGDCVSGGEIKRCLKAGIPANKIVFSGVGKTTEEIELALLKNIFQFNVESKEELLKLNQIASNANKIAPIALRINPDIDAKTHDKIATGRKDDKFGIDFDDALATYEYAKKLKNIDIQGVATHIGSQLTSLEPMEKAFRKIVLIVKTLLERNFDIRTLDFGGGLGIPYNEESPPLPEQYSKMVLSITKGLKCKLIFEPGRLICGNAGILVTKTIFLKDTGYKKFLIVDAAMNDLIRPTMYNAHHNIIPVHNKHGVLYKMDVVGPICETGDFFAKNRELPMMQAGELIAIRSAGAYGAVMSSRYNTRSLTAEVLVKGNQFKVIREPESFEDIIAKESIANW